VVFDSDISAFASSLSPPNAQIANLRHGYRIGTAALYAVLGFDSVISDILLSG